MKTPSSDKGFDLLVLVRPTHTAVCLSAAYILVRAVGDKICGWRIKAVCDSTVGPVSELGGYCVLDVCLLPMDLIRLALPNKVKNPPQ